MNKYKIISLVLAISLIASLVRLVYLTGSRTDTSKQVPSAETVLHNILNRKSVRSYTDREVSRAQLDTLTRAAMAAPTGRDMRPWKFVTIDDKKVLVKLAEKLPRAKMLTEARAAIVVCGDLGVTDDQGKPSVNWTLDCSAATENLLLQAESMGLGAVWIGVYPYEDRMPGVSEVLGLPDHIKPLNVVAIGYPKGNPQPKDKYDAGNIHYNQW